MIKTKLLKLFALSAVAFAIAGCSSNKDLFAPVESPEIDNAFKVDHVWSVGTQGTDRFFSQLVPCVYGNSMYVAGREGKVYAIDASTGKKIWTVDLSDEKENDNKRSSRLNGGMSASEQYVAVGSENGYIYVLNRQNGSIYFKYYLGLEVLTRPAFSADGTKIFVLDAKGSLNAFDLLKKERMWVSGDNTDNLHLRSQSKPLAVGNEMVIVGTPTGRVLMISQLDGFVLNQVVVGQNNGSSDLDRMSDVSSTPLLLGNEMYTTAYNAGFVEYSFAKNAITGRLAYHSSKDLAYDDNFFVITGDNGHIYCVRRSDNVEVWSNTQLSYRNVTAPAIYGNFVVVGDLEGYVYFLNLNNGKILTKISVSSDPIYVAPLVVGNSLVVYSSSGDVDVFCFDPQHIVVAKKNYTDAEAVSGNAAALMAAQSMRPQISGSGITEEALEKRRAEARKIVAQIESQQRRIEAEYREYQRRKAEYEKQVKEYERKKREELSGFGLMPSEGVKSDSDVEFVEDDSK
ncbi:MAG: PQQ-binding-like beta-propeller repeat protein [Succinivibrio sp.]|nr:PQQ-binding-like beta-propeller repeat protein [Succinivibrio sp.]